MIVETETYFESKDESFYKKGIEKIEKRWNECITLEGNYVALLKIPTLGTTSEMTLETTMETLS